MNKFIGIGNLTRDIELNQIEDLVVGKFTIAIQRDKDNTDFINCTKFNPSDYLQENMLKGTMVSVEGRIQTSNYTDKKGNKVYSTDIIVERVQILRKIQNTPQNENKGANNPYEDFGKQVEMDMYPEDTDSNLPF